MVTASGEKWWCKKAGTVCPQLSSGVSTVICVSVTISKPLAFIFILSMDGIKALGRVTVDVQSGVQFRVKEPAICAAANTVVGVVEHGFSATYDPVTNSLDGRLEVVKGQGAILCASRSKISV